MGSKYFGLETWKSGRIICLNFKLVVVFRGPLSQSEEISSDLCCFYGGGVNHNKDIMHSFQKFIVVPLSPPSLCGCKDMKISYEGAVFEFPDPRFSLLCIF